ncbi:MAG: YbaK/EbsC family protein [Chloroflexi bacterium]|jgi:Cys-tRNA(Pro) deacylase|nr:YbaK/EbsC family protein [Anaerolineaceae bacterium]NMB87436.1 YbaK/EbsC family protein [Chloroflexota bacterium]
MTDINPRTPVTRDLSARGIPFTFFEHPGPVHSLEQAARERNQRPEQVVRSILFRLRQGEFLMVLVAGPAQISWKALRSYLGQSRLTLASDQEVKDVTGYLPGSVSPFGLPQAVRTLVDQKILAEEVISIGSGQRGTTVILNTSDLLQALQQPEIGDFVEASQ